MKKFTLITAGTALLVSTTLHAEQQHHSGQHHSGQHHADAQMAKLHRMMPRYAKAQAAIDQAFLDGNAKAISKQTSYLLSTTPDLKKSRPHKNVSELTEFRQIASDFERDVQLVAGTVSEGNLDDGRAAFESAKKRCIVCHEKYRGR